MNATADIIDGGDVELDGVEVVESDPGSGQLGGKRVVSLKPEEVQIP